MQCKKKKYFLQLCLCFHSCAFVFTVVPCCCMIPTFVFAVVHFFAVVQFFCCFAICIVTYLYLVFLPKNCYTLSIVTRTVVLTDHSTPPKWVENQFQPAPYSLNLTALPHPLSPHSTLHEKLALGVRSMPLLLPLAAAVVTPVGHLLLPTPSWPVSIVAVTAVNQQTKD